MRKNIVIQKIRGICIISVILIHILKFSYNIPIYNNFNVIVRTIINFAVPIFLFLSGYLNNIKEINENKGKFYKKRFFRLYIPFIIYSIFYTLIKTKLHFTENAVVTLLKILFGMNAGHLYYIIVLLEFTLITPIIIRLINKNKTIIDVLLILITPIFLILNLIYNLLYNCLIPFYQYLPMSWFIYYYLGLVFKIRKNLFIKNFRIDINVFIFINLINIIINLIEYKFLNYDFCISQIKLTNMMYTILLINFIISKLNDDKERQSIISLIGDNSFGIYFIHMFIILVLDKLIYNNLNYYIYIILMYIFTTIISYIVVRLIKKIFKEKWSKYLGC